MTFVLFIRMNYYNPMPPTTTPDDARKQRGDATRLRLLEASVHVFGARGYDAVSTREIATAAHANQAAILYHFGSKEELYLAAAAHVAERGRAAMAAAAGPAGGKGSAPLTSAAATRALDDLLRGMVRGFVGLAADGAAARFVVREQTQPGRAFDVLYDGYIRAMHERVTALVAVATGRRASATATIIDAHAVVGMALGFVIARETLLRRVGWTEYTPAHVEAIANAVSELALSALGVSPPNAGAAAPRATRLAR